MNQYDPRSASSPVHGQASRTHTGRAIPLRVLPNLGLLTPHRGGPVVAHGLDAKGLIHRQGWLHREHGLELNHSMWSDHLNTLTPTQWSSKALREAFVRYFYTPDPAEHAVCQSTLSRRWDWKTPGPSSNISSALLFRP